MPEKQLVIHTLCYEKSAIVRNLGPCQLNLGGEGGVQWKLIDI